MPDRLLPFPEINNLEIANPLFKKDFIYLFFGEGKGRQKERKRNINVWLPLTCPLLGTWPSTQASALDWESNWRLSDSQAGSQALKHTSQD